MLICNIPVWPHNKSNELTFIINVLCVTSVFIDIYAQNVVVLNWLSVLLKDGCFCSSALQTVGGTVCLVGAAERLTLGAVESSPARAAPALPVVGAALGSVVTVTRVETIGAPVPRGTGCTRESTDTVQLRIAQPHPMNYSTLSTRARGNSVSFLLPTGI